MEENIRQLEILIDVFRSEKRELTYMIDQWENNDDPCSDTGLQYEQELKVESAYNDIKNFMLTL